MNVAPIRFGMIDPVIPKEELVVGEWYAGNGRFIGGLGMWNGFVFVGLTSSMGSQEASKALYGERGFDPVVLLKIEQVIGGVA